MLPLDFEYCGKNIQFLHHTIKLEILKYLILNVQEFQFCCCCLSLNKRLITKDNNNKSQKSPCRNEQTAVSGRANVDEGNFGGGGGINSLPKLLK